MHLTAQQLRFVRLLGMNAPELDEAVTRELEENPALEGEREDEAPSVSKNQEHDASIGVLSFGGLSRMRASGPSAADIPAADDRFTLYDDLNHQIDERKLSPEVAAVAHFLIGNLDSNGYLREPLTKLVDDMAFTMDVDVPMSVAEEALEAVRTLEPHGIGARDLQDALLLQLRYMEPSRERNDATRIVKDFFEAFMMKHDHKIISGMKVNEARVKAALELIRKLNPKPGSALGNGAGSLAAPIVPDFIVTRDENNQLTISLNNKIPELRISESFQQAMRQTEEIAAKRKEQRAERRRENEFVTHRYNDARDFITILRRRQETLFAVMTALVDIQRGYFETNDPSLLRPMMMKDIAAITGFDLSVISRATATKYVETDAGIFPLRYFFSDDKGGRTGSGETESVTNRQLEAAIKKIVEAEDCRHPMSDEKIFQRLQEDGYSIKRRTVAKYRDRLGIPVARLRKKN